MIKKIDFIKDYGVFNNFSWNGTSRGSISNFSKRNLLYGWNYSGKTTLSRVFSTLENKQCHKDYMGSSFRLILGDDTRVDNLSLEDHELSIRVFNTDFIDDNLKWGGNLEPIIILGKDSIKHQELLKKYEGEKGKNEILITENKSKIQNIENYISTSKTNIGREIKQTLDIVGTFNTRNVQDCIYQQGDNFSEFILPEEEYIKNLRIYRSNEKKEDILFNNNYKNIDEEQINREVQRLLNKTIIKKVKHNLDDDPAIYSWVNTGHKLHSGKKKCLFCNNTISVERWEFLNNIFSHENDSLNNEIDSFISSLEKMIPEIVLFNKLELYSELQSEYETITKNLIDKIKLIKNNIKDIGILLNEKKTKLYETIQLKKRIIIPSITEEINKINQIVENHNNKNKSFEESKEVAKGILINHFIGNFTRTNNFDDKIIDLNNLAIENSSLEKENINIDIEIKKIQEFISEEARGAQTINGFLNLYFGKDDIVLRVNNEKKYQLVRQGQIAKNLSEGEKTAISFSYFLAKLHDKNTVLKNTILYIDDPISSLDSNHLYNTFALIKNKLRDCQQIFISTHNYEFFKLLRDDSFFKEYSKSNVKTASYYLIKRLNRETADLINLPTALKKYNSEYHFLFTTLLKMKSEEIIDDSCLFTVPNMSRKLLEIFTSFKIPNTKITLDQRLIMLCNSEQEAHRIYKFINHLSHSDSITFSIEFPTHHECKEILISIFEMIKRVDPQHYEGMLKIAARTRI